MKYIIALLLLVPAFNLCRAELTLPKIERPVIENPDMHPKKQAKKPVRQEDLNKQLVLAADKMHLRGIYNALIAGADINALYNGVSALHMAIYANSPGTVKYLIKCGSDKQRL